MESSGCGFLESPVDAISLNTEVDFNQPLNIGIEKDNIGLYETNETCLIEDIDANGYLVNNEDSKTEYENQTQIDVDFDFDENEFDGETFVGKVFDKLEEVYTFYNRYALLHGFGIRSHSVHKNRITNEPYQKMYVCNKQGFKKVKVDCSGVDTKKRQRDSRTGCEAELQVSKTKDGKWVVDKFSDTHNHDLTTTLTKVMKHRSHAKFHRPMACKSVMVTLGKFGLRPSQIKKAVNAIKSPFEADVTSKQYADILVEQRKQYKGKEFCGLIKHFQDKASVDINYKHPKAIITDQDKAMGNAIKKVFPSTRHRYCACHIRKHELEHLRSFMARYDDFEETYRKWVKSDTVEEFESQAVDCRRAAEEDEDFKTMNSMPILSSVHPIEPKAGKFYTRKIFELFKKEWNEATNNLTHENLSKSAEESNYRVGQVNENVATSIEEAKDSPAEVKRLNSLFVKFLEDQAVRKKPTEVQNAYEDSSKISQVDMMPQISIRDPIVQTKTKGRPKSTSRIKSSLEVVKKKKTCSHCKELGHYITGCPQKKGRGFFERKIC
ncbi:hypothetical protein OSB04_011275 [Centaurea solstitialis]|uniref:Protein FAR1-RELATED SEQUENCE n=1 Tax=Centaurea solstitialis TaxID=347529 RepID=A0AA38TJV2_9ASTR|nr:hypothetical protein OSB04_011275 [Centaurea solstitialis]